MHFIVEYAGKCDYCQRSLAKAGRSYTFFFFYFLAKVKKLFVCYADFNLFCLQLYMAPITHSDRYNESIDFWRNVYGIDSEHTSTN